MIDNQEAAIFKSKQDFNKNKEKISQYIKYAENWQVASVICSYAAMACDVLLIVAMIVFLLKYHKTMQAMLAAFLQMNTKNTGMQSVQADQIGVPCCCICWEGLDSGSYWILSRINN